MPARATLALVLALLVAPGEAHAQSPGPGVRTPPQLVTSSEPALPAGASPGVVDLHVTIETDGSISEAHADGEHDPALEQAAIEAVRTWRFAPATRDGAPVRARAVVEVHFAAPLAESASEGEGEDAGAGEDAGPAETEGEAESEDGSAATGEGEGEEEAETETETEEVYSATGSVDPIAQAAAPRAASDYALGSDLIGAAPHRDAGDLLASAPGVYVARGEGDGVAHSIFLRGFDAEHGQDLELTMGGVPLNQPSHLHGQGYADLGFLIPEVVQAIRVTEGVYDPHQGDFATAGSIAFDLGVERRGLVSRTSYGSFDTFRQLLLWAPVGERNGTFGAVSYRRTSGYGAHRGGESGSAMFQYEAGGSGNVRGRITATLYGARYGLAGILRDDDVAAGRIDFYGSYPDASAASQSSFAVRALLAGTVDILGERGSFGEIGAWLGYTDFRLQANYTGYTQVSHVDPSWRGRGDLIEQRNSVVSMGLRGRWRSERYTPFDWASIFVELGATGRLDLTSQQQNLLDATNNQTWDNRVDAEIRGGDVGGFLDLDVHLTDFVRLRGGVRADVLLYDVDDRLGNFAPAFRPTTFIDGFRRTALGVAAGPRASLEVTPVQGLTLSLSYGEGYRSPQARTLADGETAPFAKVRSGDLGLRFVHGARRELELTLAGYVTTLSNDVAFDPQEGRLEALGPSTRLGGSLYVVARPLTWLLGALSVTYVRATLDGPPLATALDPAPPYVSGQALPYVPPIVVRADVSANEQVATLADLPFRIRGGAGFSMLGARPLPYGDEAPAFGLLDVSAGASWGPVDLSLDVFNLLDQRYQATAYSFASNWSPTQVPSRVPAPSFAAGAPLTVMSTLGVRIE